MKIGFIGLGTMGGPMAGHLLKRFGSLVVWNRTPARAEALVSQGARSVDSPRTLAESCDVICLCVADTPDVESVVFGGDGLYDGLRSGTLIIDFSTISAKATEQFAARVRAQGAGWVDAPMSGGDVGARNATLTIMAGGSEQDYARALPILEAIGKNLFHMGPVGNGQRTKLANQIGVVGTIVSMGEAFNFARESGMDVEKVWQVISSGAAGSWSLSNYGPRALRGDWKPGFAASLMAKDMRLVLEALEGLGSDYTLVRRMTEFYEAMAREGEGNLGNHAVIRRLGWRE